MKYKYYLIFFFLIASCKPQAYKTPSAEHQAEASKGMVVSAHPLASQAGVEILKQGGNAVDAWIATHLALAVVNPRAGNIGGGGFAIIRLPDGKAFALDFREKAPEKAHKNLYLDENGNIIEGLSIEGGLAVGIPGSVAGLYEAWKKFGNLEWKQLVQPAIELAERGFQITAKEAERLHKYQEVFKKYNPDDNIFIKDKWKQGDVLIQKDLAKTLTIIAQKGIVGFYQGEVAEALVRKVQKAGGIITLEDLKNYRAVFRKPVSVRYKQYNVISMPPPSSGGVALGQLLKIVDDYPVRNWGFHTYRTTHLMVEAEKRVYADRAKYLGDPDYYPVPVDTLLADWYLQEKMKDFDPEKATPTDSIWKDKYVMTKESFETTHISVVDANRMAVSCTTTLNSNYGSKVLVDGFGFFLNNEMDDFSAKPGVPNQFGLIGGAANSIAPGKRMLSSMTPTIVEKNGKLFMVLGTPGGSTIITSVFQVFLNVVEFDMNIFDAVQVTRFHHQFLPDEIMYEKNCFSPPVMDSLQQAGHHLREVQRLGYVKAILMEDNKLYGSGDMRNPDDDVEGY